MTEPDELLDVVGKLNEEFQSEKDFNVFDAIRFRSQEVMHSKFIVTLLDPKGQHKMGIKFLEKFLERIKYSGFDANNVTVWSERQAKIERLAKTRWIDITIENKNTILIIENKIWAEDQPQQLEDYYKFCVDENKWEKVEVFYLTPYGHKPNEGSIGEKIKIDKVKVKLISYEKHIIPWIFECSRDKEVKGRLKYSLEMYHEILQIAINRSHYMNEIFEELKKDKSKLKLAIDIASTLQGRNYIKEFPEIKSLMKELVEEIFVETGTTIVFEPDPYSSLEEVTGIVIYLKNVPEKEAWSLHFEDEFVYLCDDKEDKTINPLFYPTDFNNKLLQSLLKEDKETASEILRNELKKIYSFL